MKIAVFHRLSFGDTELRLNEEAEKLGIKLVWIKYRQLRLDNEKIFFEETDLADFDGWYFRAVGSELEWSKLLSMYAKKYGVRVIDEYILNEGVLRRFKSVMSWQLLNAAIPYPKSSFVNTLADLKEELEKWQFPLIVKLSSGGRHGMGTFFLKSMEDFIELKRKLNLRAEEEKKEKGFSILRRGFLIQEFIENDGDYRVMTVGYKCVGGFKRQPKVEKIIFNQSVGKSLGLKKVPSDVAEIAEKAARILEVEVAGTDLVRSKKDGKVYLIEVNEAPQFKVFEKRTGINVAKEILKYAENKFKK